LENLERNRYFHLYRCEIEVNAPSNLEFIVHSLALGVIAGANILKLARVASRLHRTGARCSATLIISHWCHLI
jgi:hypothetical protein